MSQPTPDYQLVRSSRRKTLAIRVSHTGVEVRAPHRVSLREIERFVRSRREWIEHHQQRLAQLPSPESLQKQYQPGELFQYRGENYPLRIQKGARAGVSCADGQLQVTLGPRQSADSSAVVKRLLEQWYRDRALAELSERSNQMAARIGRKPGTIRVRRTRSKWGHCTVQGDLQYNWLIMTAPDAVIDYLVAHEVSHLVHHNHSRAFWQQVGELCPDWKTQRDWLRRHGYQLQV